MQRVGMQQAKKRKSSMLETQEERETGGNTIKRNIREIVTIRLLRNSVDPVNESMSFYSKSS